MQRSIHVYFCKLIKKKKMFSNFCCVKVTALKAVRHALRDPHKRLRNWRKTDPCSSNWVGVICFNSSDKVDGYLHVQEL